MTMARVRTKTGVPPPAEMPPAEEIDVKAVLESYLKGEIDLICVLGPTASGKTRYAVSLCRRINGLLGDHAASGAEILSADSRQVYRGMDIGTGKDLIEYQEIPYHLIDIAEAGERYNIFDFQQDFEKAYRDIRERGGIPVLCGGSGLYIEAATCGYSLPQVPPDYAWREEMEKKDIETLREELLSLKAGTATDGGTEKAEISIEPAIWESKRRLVRAIEVAQYEKDRPAIRSSFLPKNTYFIGTLVSREERNARIDRRLDERINEGMAEEVKGLLDKGIPQEDLIYYGLEYKFVTQYVLGVLSLEEMRTLLANAIHRFAKRQMTWFRGMERDGKVIHWTQVP